MSPRFKWHHRAPGRWEVFARPGAPLAAFPTEAQAERVAAALEVAYGMGFDAGHRAAAEPDVVDGRGDWIEQYRADLDARRGES